jgi:hypothetical protein
LVGISPNLRADEFTFTTFSVPGSVYGTFAEGINDLGEIVGYYSDSQGNAQGFYRSAAGVLSPLNFPGATSTEVYGINKSGAISGLYRNAQGTFGFVEFGGVYASFVIPGESFPATEGFGINNIAQVIVYSQAIGAPTWVRSADGATYTITSVPGAPWNVGRGINDSGQTVGTACLGPNCQLPYLMEADHVSYSLLSVPGATQGASAFGINNLGDIVGEGSSTTNEFGFVRLADGAYDMLQVPGGIYTNINGINDREWIVGNFSDSTGTYAFLAEPVPEPNSLLLLATCLLGLGWTFRTK